MLYYMADDYDRPTRADYQICRGEDKCPLSARICGISVPRSAPGVGGGTRRGTSLGRCHGPAGDTYAAARGGCRSGRTNDEIGSESRFRFC